ncbi:glycosyltransferase [Synechococcus sp. PCC 7502]|uniref:glycosyltransferase n=1 Tax=Synechococcus sp. PCC 7502 TaxID=1173263 RepID=UPI00029FC802|nr:glycosyltransferase [Synechococcus sp. PCC 7502]AFY72512.1 glycosyltransferase [Synechococcus sp. PCC 7502]
MKVLHIIPSISPKLGGPTQVVLNLVMALREEGIDVEIATTNDDGDRLLDVPLWQRVEYQGLPVWFFPRFAQIKDFLPSFSFTRWLWRNIRNYDILDNHYLFSYLPSCAAIIAQWQRVPYTTRTMGQLAPWALAQSKLRKQIYTYLIERRNLDQAAAIHCTSIGEKEDVINFGLKPPKIVLPLGVIPPQIIPNAQQELRNKYGLSPNIPIILFLSRLHYKKRPDLLIESLTELSKHHQDFYLLMAGSGEEKYVQSLLNLVTSLHLEDKVVFVGFVSGYAKDLLLQGADLFVLPTYSENFGIALAEAMVSGLPIITTSGAQIADEITFAEAGLIIDGDINSLAQAIADLLNNPQLRLKMGENGRKYALEKYSWTTIAKQLARAYQGIIEQ